MRNLEPTLLFSPTNFNSIILILETKVFSTKTNNCPLSSLLRLKTQKNTSKLFINPLSVRITWMCPFCWSMLEINNASTWNKRWSGNTQFCWRKFPSSCTVSILLLIPSSWIFANKIALWCSYQWKVNWWEPRLCCLSMVCLEVTMCRESLLFPWCI